MVAGYIKPSRTNQDNIPTVSKEHVDYVLNTLKNEIIELEIKIEYKRGQLREINKIIEETDQAIAKAEGKSSCCGCPQGKEYIHCGCDCHKAEGKKECGHEPEDTQYCNCHKAEGK